MKINANKKINLEDFGQKDRDLIQKLAQILNPFMDQTNQALTSNLTADNLKAKVWSIEIPASASAQTVTVAWPLNEKPSEVRLAKLALKDGTAIADVFSMTWEYVSGQSGNTVKLTFIGLANAIHLATVIGQV